MSTVPKDIWQTTQFNGHIPVGEPWKFCPILINATPNAMEIMLTEEGQAEMNKVNKACIEFIQWLRNHPDWEPPHEQG